MSLNLRTTRKIRYYESIIVVMVVMVVSKVEDDEKSFRIERTMYRSYSEQNARIRCYVRVRYVQGIARVKIFS